MRTCVLQWVLDDRYAHLLNATWHWHSKQCHKHGYRYIVRTGQYTEREPCWEEIKFIQDAIEDGFEHIVWLDADTVWTGVPLLVPPTVFGLAWHDAYAPPHYNQGVVYINNTNGQAAEPVKEWWNTPYGSHWMGSQHSLNVMLQAKPELVTRIGHEWNSVGYIPQYTNGTPIVHAWHGTSGSCLDAMQQVLKSLTTTE